jgi:hypothetical protein
MMDKEKKIYNAITELPDDLTEEVNGSQFGAEYSVSIIKFGWKQWAGLAAMLMLLVSAVVFVPNWNGEDMTPLSSDTATTNKTTEPISLSAPPTTNTEPPYTPASPALTETSGNAPGTTAQTIDSTTVTTTPRNEITEEQATDIAFARFREIWGESQGVIVGIASGDVFYSIEITRVGETEPLMKFDISMKSGEIIREYDLSNLSDARFTKDRVMIVEGGNEYEVLEQFLHAWSEEMSASGMAMIEPWEANERLNIIVYTSDFRVEFKDSQHLSSARFVMYDSNYNLIYNDASQFSPPPPNPGVYFLEIAASWNNEETGSGSAHQFWAKIVVPYL